MNDYYPESSRYASERAIARIDAMSIVCSYCHAGIDQECFDPHNKEFTLGKQPAHMKRLIESGWQG